MAQTRETRALELHEVLSIDQRLARLPNEIERPVDREEEHSQSLPRCDGGKEAWRLLITMFIFESLLWGFPLSYGVFQNYYSQSPEFHGSPYISAIGTTASGIIYIGAPVMIPLVKRFSRHRRRMVWIGWPICLLSLVAGSFARSIPSLILTQGVMYGLGFILFYYPILSMTFEFWVERRGFAAGICCSASGLSGVAMPFCVTALLHRYGYPTTLRIIAAALFAMTGPLIPLLKGRIPESRTSHASRTDWTFLRTPLFWIYNLSNLFMGLGYFLPSLYLPSYVTSLGGSANQGAVLLAIMSVTQVAGQVMFGYLSDKKLSLNVLIFSSTLVASVATFTCWGLAHSFAPLLAFSLIYGFFGAGYTAMWTRMGMAISNEPNAAFTSFGLLNLGKGIGNVLTGVVSGVLLMGSIDVESYGIKRYQTMVIFTGSCMALSAAIIPLSYLRR